MAEEDDTFSYFLFDDQRISGFQSGKNGNIFFKICPAFIELYPVVNLSIGKTSISWIIKKREGGVFEKRRDNMSPNAFSGALSFV